MHYEQFQDGSVKCIEDEIPFEIPESWEWCRFGTYTINRDNERKPVSLSNRKDVEKNYDYYGASGKIDKIDDYIFDEKLLLIGEDGANLVARTKPIAFFAEGKYWVNNHAHCIDAIDKQLLEFLCYYINAIDLKMYITGAAQPKLNQDNMNKILLPIPPQYEQEKIICEISNSFQCVLHIDHHIANLKAEISLLKTKILDLAIRGKLVPQDPNDEPASVLLERIRAEKEELVKQGKIKRDKKKSIIFKGEDNSYYEKIGNQVTCIDSEIAFEIPENWAWSRLSSFTEIVMGSSPKGEDICADSSFTEFHQGKIYFSKQYINCSMQYTKNISKLASKNSVLLCVRAPVGEVNITNRDICIGRGLSSILPLDDIDSIFLFYWLKTFKKEFTNKSTGSTFSAITSDIVKNILLPVPPLNEQNKITKTITDMFNYLEHIEASLN